MTRYELFKASGSGETVYSIWLYRMIGEWAASSRRGKEIAQERRDGWKFPVLRSQQDHDEFDLWLAEQVKGEK